MVQKNKLFFILSLIGFNLVASDDQGKIQAAINAAIQGSGNQATKALQAQLLAEALQEQFEFKKLCTMVNDWMRDVEIAKAKRKVQKEGKAQVTNVSGL